MDDKVDFTTRKSDSRKPIATSFLAAPKSSARLSRRPQIQRSPLPPSPQSSARLPARLRPSAMAGRRPLLQPSPPPKQGENSPVTGFHGRDGDRNGAGTPRAPAGRPRPPPPGPGAAAGSSRRAGPEDDACVGIFTEVSHEGLEMRTAIRRRGAPPAY